MKKYSTNYRIWFSDLGKYLFFLGINIYILISALGYERKYAGDLNYILLPALSSIILLLGTYFIISQFNLVINGTTGDVIFQNNQLIIENKGISKKYKYSELKSIEFVDRSSTTFRNISQRGPNWYSYCVMKFSSGKVVLTALNIENDEIARNMNINQNAVKNRERKIFELIG